MSEKKLKVADILSITLSTITLITVISVGFFWFYKTDELPRKVQETNLRVELAESRLDKLELQMVENSTKTQLIYQGVLEIRSVLLKK